MEIVRVKPRENWMFWNKHVWLSKWKVKPFFGCGHGPRARLHFLMAKDALRALCN